MKNDVIHIAAHFEKRTSKEGNLYEVLMLQLTDDYEKEVYISKAETQLLKLSNKNSVPTIPANDIPFL